MPLVRIIKNWKNPDLLRQTPGGKGKWGNLEFTLDTVDSCDYVLVLNRVTDDASVKCPRGNIFAMMQEPYIPGIFDWMVNGHEQFDRVFTHHIFNNHPKYIATQTCLPWHVNRTYDELMASSIPAKTKSISWITTNKIIFPGHKLRMKFYEELKKETSFNVDFYGHGIKFIEDKWDALSPYKYSLAIENNSSAHYWTEKIADCYLSYTLPIYYGCTNLEKYFPEESFVRIDINDYKESKRVIEDIMKNDIWKSRLDAIIEARELVLQKYQLFPFITDILTSSNKNNNLSQKRETINLKAYDDKEMESRPPRISVIVCTYNRMDLLSGCLESLVNQDVDNHNFEVIVIDNNSTDATQAVTDKFVKENRNFRNFFQRDQGLSHARNMGIEKARANYVAFVDDDEIISSHWIKVALGIIEDQQPDIFGGPVLPVFSAAKPEWYKYKYGIRGDMGGTGWLEKGFLLGGNIFFKKEILKEYGGFDPDLGMKGNTVSYHEETKIVLRALKESKKVYYANELAVNDIIPDYKLSLLFFITSKYKSGASGLDLWKPDFDKKKILMDIIRLLDNIIDDFDFALKRRDPEKYLFPENYIVENVIQKFFRLGMMVKFLSNELQNLQKEVLVSKEENLPHHDTSIGKMPLQKSIKLKLLNILKKIFKRFKLLN